MKMNPKEESKQETLEEAAENHWKMQCIMPLYESTKPYIIKDFIAGANWQKERMYSEEEVLNVIFKFSSDFDLKKGIEISLEEQKEWFEKFKKK